MSNTQTQDNPLVVQLKNVRLSFPAIFQAKAMANDPNSKPAYSATFIMDKVKNAGDIAKLKAAAEFAKKQQWPNKNVSPKMFLHDGSEKADLDGYGDTVMYVSARNQKPIFVVDQKLVPLKEADGKPYAGCYVNAVVRVWAQDNEYGKRINAALGNIQFLRDGEPFGEVARTPEQDFQEIDEPVV